MDLKNIIIKLGQNDSTYELLAEINLRWKWANEAKSEEERQDYISGISDFADILLKYARLWELDLAIEKATQERDALLQGLKP